MYNVFNFQENLFVYTVKPAYVIQSITNISFNMTDRPFTSILKISVKKQIYIVKPVLRGYFWDKEKSGLLRQVTF
jgi:hypothetical protein